MFNKDKDKAEYLNTELANLAAAQAIGTIAQVIRAFNEQDKQAIIQAATKEVAEYKQQDSSDHFLDEYDNKYYAMHTFSWRGKDYVSYVDARFSSKILVAPLDHFVGRFAPF